MKIIEMTDQKCVIIAKRRDNEDSLKYEMTLDEAQRAGLTGKQNWQTNPKQMLYCACVRNVFRILFSDIAIPYDADEMNADENLAQQQDLGIAEILSAETIQPEPQIIDPRASNAEIEASRDSGPYSDLASKLKGDGIAIDRLEEWVKARCQTKDLSPEACVQACLAAYPSFKKSFVKWLTPEEVPA